MSSWERVSDLFERALALPPQERGAFLERECAEDVALHAELESLLEAYTAARTFFDDLEAELVGPSVGGLIDAPGIIPAGAVVGSYQIEESIGSGGMGIVYRAHDRKLDRTVALKFIAPELTHDRGASERLLREARAAAALDDPRIAAIHTLEETAGGRLFLVMPFYAGETLKQRLTRGRLDAHEAVAVATEVAEGLSRAHRAGIVHRDIKPANVLIMDTGGVKVLDFGVAKLTTGAALTRTGGMVGTAAYMSPEQVRGEAADPRSDVWSLGVLLYEMLAGSRPFRGDTESAVMYAVLERSPEPLRAHAPDVPDSLLALIDAMLAKDPALRPADGGAAAEALRRMVVKQASVVEQPLGGDRVVAFRTPSATATVASTKRGRRPTRPAVGWRGAVLAVILAGLIAVGAFRILQMDGGPPPQSAAIAVLPFVIRGDTELAYLRDGMVHLLSTKLDGIGDLRPVDPHALLASFGSGNRTPDPATGRTVAATFGADAFILGAVLRIGDGIELSASLYGEDGELQTTSAAMAKEDADLSSAVDELVRDLVSHRLAADTGAPLAGLAAMTTRSLPALRAYLEGEGLLRSNRPAAALSSFQHAVALDSTFSLAWYRLARAAGWVGPTSLNEEAAAQAVRYSGVLPERTRSLVSAYRVFRVGDPVEAERLYRGVLTTYPGDMEALELLAETLFHNNPFLGRSTAEAREPLERALAMDPGNRELMVHLMDLAARDGRLGALDTISARYLSPESGGDAATALHAYAALRVLALEPPNRHEHALSALAAAGPEAIFDALVRVAPQLRDPELSDRLAGMLADQPHDAALGAAGHLHRAWLAVARGRWNAAETHWDAAEPIQPGWTLVHRVLAATFPHAPVTSEKLESLKSAVAAWTPDGALEDGQHEGDTEALRIYLLGLLDWRAGEDAGLVRAIAELRALASMGSKAAEGGRPVSGTPGLASAFAETLTALDLWRADGPTDALAALDRARLRIPFHRRARSPLLEQHLNRFLRAEVLRALGPGRADAAEADDRALRLYASLEDGYFHWGAPFIGPALIASAEIHVRHGRIAEAAAAYERFLALWGEADPELHTWLELARRRLVSLGPAG